MRMLRRFAGLIAAVAFLLEAGSVAVLAQRPFRMYEPFYRDESARRAFFDGFAVTAELSYRAPGTLSQTAAPVLPAVRAEAFSDAEHAVVPAPAGALAVVFNIDYQLAPQLDLSAVVDASGSLTGRSAALSWLALKRYWHANGTDYALRLAIDPHPSPKQGFGFRQVDLAVLVTTLLSRRVSMDLLGGVRRAHIGYQRLLAAGAVPLLAMDGPATGQSDIVLSQAGGREIHLMIRYNVHFDPARSHIFASALYEAGSYEIVERLLSEVGNDPSSQDPESFRGQVVWIRTGLSWHRPGYKVAPFISIPALTWKRQSKDLLDAQERQRANLGLRITLR